METIRGLTNWRLTLRREADSVTILRAVSCDRRAVLPETLFGLPVTALHDRALAHGAAPLEGEELLILGGAESGDWDNRNITQLSLPRTLKTVGDYAFMNLRAMETLRFFDSLRSTGSASLMNCRAFRKIELTRLSQTQGPALASIVRSLPRELDAEILGADGSVLRLIFPEYFENYFENKPAHYFQLQISGGGYAYHQVFRDKALSVPEYDALWPAYLAGEHDEDSALRLAFYRLLYPAELGQTARERYAAWLRQKPGPALSLALQSRDAAGLRLLLGLGELSPETLGRAMDESRALGFTEATALLLETGRAGSGRGRARRFEL